MTQIFIEGFLLQASLILALGAQNIFVLHSGLRRQRHLLVALVSSICDTALVFIGVLGISTFFIKVPLLKITLGVVGVAFLFIYGVLKLKEVKVGTELSKVIKPAVTLRQAILTSLGFSLLNPHVYLDTVILIGGYSAKFGQLFERFTFGLGASSFSVVWFFGLATFSSIGSGLLNNKKAMRLFSLLSGLILVFLAFKLGGEVLVWMAQ